MNGSCFVRLVVNRVMALTLGVAIVVGVWGCASSWTPEVRSALAQAGDNRPELERVLKHYRDANDEQKLEAAEFLIANMPGHGYTLAAFYDKDKNEVPFDALDYKSYKEARDAIDALEKEHGELHYARKRFDDDIKTITADDLIENIDLAFEAWKTKPWAKDISFHAFCESILPYRGSNEPINSWRRSCMDRYADVPEKISNVTNAAEAGGTIQKDASKWVGFNELYYLHPTDQGFDEMREHRLGRCEDMTNMQLYALRANAIPVAADYTPWWADRDNNHAWQVFLDADGHGSAKLFSRAAKVYRKTFSIQRDSLAMTKNAEEKVPRWLAGKNYIDVSDQYMDTTDVTIELVGPVPEGSHHAYLCVFNGGVWRAIHWGRINHGKATFTKMGRNIAYIPAYFVDDELVPAAPAFILTKQGEVRPLVADAGRPITFELTATKPETKDADSRSTFPQIVVKPDQGYELFVWEDGWTSLGKYTGADEPIRVENVPGGGLYWLVADGSRKLERIFTIEDGKQVWW